MGTPEGGKDRKRGYVSLTENVISSPSELKGKKQTGGEGGRININ